jgi:hypothetical protein
VEGVEILIHALRSIRRSFFARGIGFLRFCHAAAGLDCVFEHMLAPCSDG